MKAQQGAHQTTIKLTSNNKMMKIIIIIKEAL